MEALSMQEAGKGVGCVGESWTVYRKFRKKRWYSRKP